MREKEEASYVYLLTQQEDDYILFDNDLWQSCLDNILDDYIPVDQAIDQDSMSEDQQYNALMTIE